MDVNLISSMPKTATLDEALAVYQATFGQPPYGGVHPQAGPAQRLYQSRGWTVLTNEFRTQPDQLAYWVMGRTL